MSVELRTAAAAEARLAADLETRARPQEPIDPPTLAYDLKHPGAKGHHHLHLVLDGATPIGVATYRHPDGVAWNPGRLTTLRLVLVPEAGASASEALGRLEALALADHPKRLRSWSRNAECYLNGALVAAGYEHTGSGVEQELDLMAGRDRLLALREQTRARMAEQGIVLCHGRQVTRERLLDQVVQLSNNARHEVRDTVDEPDADRAAVEEGMRSPSFHLDRFWMAWDGDRLVAMSYLDFPVERGHVHTHNTASDRAYRGRGIAQAVKNESVGQAVELGLTRIRTGNDSQNGPMLAINRHPYPRSSARLTWTST